MEDKWLDEIRESLSAFEMDTPDGLWESLGIEKPVSKASWRRRLMVAAAVISILMIGSGIIFWMAQTKPIEINDIKYAMTTGMPNITLHESNSNDNKASTSSLKKNIRLNRTQSPKNITQNNSEKTEPEPDHQTHNPTNETKKEKELGLEGKKNLYVNSNTKIDNRKKYSSDK